MCGIAGIFGNDWRTDVMEAMIASQQHRGPDGEGLYVDPDHQCTLGHNRLSIIDLSEAGRQPMVSSHGNLVIALNGEIYNYLELRKELEDKYRFKTKSDTEVLLAAFETWGPKCLDKLIGMFAFIIWDEKEKKAFIARDRFGVKPLYYSEKSSGTLIVASEIKALHAAGIPRCVNENTWATYLAFGQYDHSKHTFWRNIYSLPAGHFLQWSKNRIEFSKWYDIADRVGKNIDLRSEEEVEDEYFELIRESVKLRFRSDVPVGINLSGGLDSSTLLGVVNDIQPSRSDVKAFTFVTGDAKYDELPWVKEMLTTTNHSLIVSRLTAKDVPTLALDVQYYQDEPFGGLPTLAYAKLFEKAKELGVTVLLDGNGMDEQWAGYDYYRSALNGNAANLVQGTTECPVRPDCLMPEFRRLASPGDIPVVFDDRLRNLQYRDTKFTKIPRAMRFNDRASMRSSIELREPFLDHRLFELAMIQSTDRKLSATTGKKMLRDISRRFVPQALSSALKRPVQTPQREWLRGELRDWADTCIRDACHQFDGSWLDQTKLLLEWERFCRGESDNSFYVWQWISLSLVMNKRTASFIR